MPPTAPPIPVTSRSNAFGLDLRSQHPLPKKTGP